LGAALQHPRRPLPWRPAPTGPTRLGSPRLGDRIGRLLAQPRAWTIPLLYRYLGRPAISLHTLHRRVREVAAWRRPRLVAKGDPDRDQVLAALRQQIRDLPEGAVLLAEDETHVNLLPWVRASWVVRGTRQRVMTPGTNRRRTIFGAVDLHSGRFLYQVCRKAVSVSFTGFCEQLLAAYPTAPVVAVICDNVIIHHSKIVQAWLASHPRVRVLHGARYSPHDNPVERIWAPSRPTLRTRRRRPWPGGSAKSMPSSANAAPPSYWSPPPPTAHPGSPKDTDRTFGRPLRWVRSGGIQAATWPGGPVAPGS
jgi:hypothetical protein